MTSLCIIDFSLANFQLFQNTHRKFFFFESVLLKSEILHYRAEALEKRGQFRNDFLWIFKILEDVFLSEHFQNVSVVHFGSRL